MLSSCLKKSTKSFKPEALAINSGIKYIPLYSPARISEFSDCHQYSRIQSHLADSSDDLSYTLKPHWIVPFNVVHTLERSMSEPDIHDQ